MATTMSYSKDAAGPVRKKLKTSEIPISRETRKVIEDLAHKFKKKGGYDSLRKQVWDDLRNSVRWIFIFLLAVLVNRDRTSKSSSPRT